MAEPFSCHRCGHCCHGGLGIVLTLADQQRIATHLGISPEQFLAQATVWHNGKRYLAVGHDGYCHFFLAKASDGSPGCGIHEARPNVCRAWPYFRGNMLDALSWTMAAEDCPGIDTASGHEAFVAAGHEYIRRHALSADSGAESPNALVLGNDPFGQSLT